MRTKDKMQYTFAFLAALLYICTTRAAGYPEVRYEYPSESSSEALHGTIGAEDRLPYSDEALIESRLPYGFYDWSLYNTAWAAEMQQRKNKIREERQDEVR